MHPSYFLKKHPLTVIIVSITDERSMYPLAKTNLIDVFSKSLNSVLFDKRNTLFIERSLQDPSIRNCFL